MGDIFNQLCLKKSWTDIACMLIESESMDVNAFIRFGEEEYTSLLMAAVDWCLDVAEALLKAPSHFGPACASQAWPSAEP
jgi:hypothetical protein